MRCSPKSTSSNPERRQPGFPIQAYIILGCDFKRWGFKDFAIHADPTCLDQAFGFAARGHTGTGQHLSDPVAGRGFVGHDAGLWPETPQAQPKKYRVSVASNPAARNA